MKKTESTQRRKGAEKPQRCGNCLDGKLLMAGETCGVCGNREPVKPKPKSEVLGKWVAPSKSYQAYVQVGDVRVVRMENGQLWLTHRGGEGMAVKEERLAKVLEDFFRREF